MITIEDVRLNQLAKELQDTFARWKESRDKRPYKPHPRTKKLDTWLKIARTVRRLNANPDDFVAAQFHSIPGTIFANHLLGQNAVSRYESYIQRFGVPNVHKQQVDSSSVAVDKIVFTQMQESTRLSKILGKSFQLNKETIKDPKVKKAILDYSWLCNPLYVLMQDPTDEELRDTFLLDALNELEEDPSLRAGYAALNYDTSLLYNVET